MQNTWISATLSDKELEIGDELKCGLLWWGRCGYIKICGQAVENRRNYKVMSTVIFSNMKDNVIYSYGYYGAGTSQVHHLDETALAFCDINDGKNTNGLALFF